jgi:protein-tyrosine-phosphatase
MGATCAGDGGCLCPAGQVVCGDRCVDVATDVANCGGCGLACGTLEKCTAGACACEPSATRCGDKCFALATDTSHCGACDTACASLQTCDAGSCKCPAGSSLCDGRCSVTAEDARAFHAASAGSHPKALHPAAVRVLREHYGIDLADHQPTHLDTLSGQRFDYVISLCDKVREICPEYPGHPDAVHWSIADPADTTPSDNADDAAFRQLADELDTRIRYLLPVLAASRQPEKEKESCL